MKYWKKLKLPCAKWWKNTPRLVCCCSLLVLASCNTETNTPISEWGNFVGQIQILENEPGPLLKNQIAPDKIWPTFGANIAKLKTQNVPQILIYGKGFAKDEYVEFHPVGVFKVEHKGQTLKWAVATPVDPKNQTLVLTSYFDFQKSCLQCKFDIEKWIQEQLPGAIYLGWEDEIAADKWLRSVLRTPLK